MTRAKLVLDPPLVHDLGGVGIDPGQTNMGMAFVYRGHADIYQIKMPSHLDSTSRIQASAIVAQYILGLQIGPEKDWLDFRGNRCQCVIEGAAFGAIDGQVALAENRTTIAIEAMREYLPVLIVPPSEIKMHIFGKGNMRAKEFWPFLKIRDEKEKLDRDDAAAALACAFYAYALKRKELLLSE